MTQRVERRIEKWQWWLLGVWLVFIAVVGFIVLFRLSSIRTAAPPPLPAASTEFKLGDGPEIEIRGRVLMPDGSPVPPRSLIVTRNITYNGVEYDHVSTDGAGYYAAKPNIGAKFTASLKPYTTGSTYAKGAISVPHAILATTVVEHPEPGRYDILVARNKIRVHGKFRYPNGTPAPAGRALLVREHVFGRPPVVLARDDAGNVREEAIINHTVRKTDDDGAYEIFLPPGEYTFDADGFLYEDAPSEEVTLTTGDADREIDFTVQPSSRFHFVLPEGVKPRQEEMKMFSTAVSVSTNFHDQRLARHPDGKFDILLARNGTHIIAETDTESGPYGIALVFLGVERLEPMTVTLQPAAKAKIRLLDKKDGVPLAGLELYCNARFSAYDQYSNLDRAHNSGTLFGERVKTDENGVAILGPLYIGGEYDFSIQDALWPFSPRFRPVEGGKLYDLGDWKVPAYLIEYAARGQKPEDATPPEQENNATKTPTPEEP